MALEPMGYTAANRRSIKLMVEQAAPLFQDSSAPMFMVMADAIAALDVGKLFYAIAPAGAANEGVKRFYLRTAIAPFFEDQGDVAAPVTAATLNAAISYLEDKIDFNNPPVLGSFTATPSQAERGASVAAVALAITTNRTDRPVAITGTTVGTIPVGSTTLNVAGPFTADAAWTATQQDSIDPAPPASVRTAGLSFRDSRRWGKIAGATIDNAGLLALSSELATSASARAVKTLTLAAERLVYAQPASWPTYPTILVGGFATDAFTETIADFTNQHGAVVSYRVRIFDNPLTGTVEVTF